MKRDEYLKAVEACAAKHGFISDELVEIGRTVRVSADAVSSARWRGNKAREKIYIDAGYWAAEERESKAREAIKRHLSCGFRMDTPEAKKLIKELHDSKDERRKCYLKACKITGKTPDPERED